MKMRYQRQLGPPLCLIYGPAWHMSMAMKGIDGDIPDTRILLALSAAVKITTPSIVISRENQ